MLIYKKDELKATATDELGLVAQAIKTYMGDKGGFASIPVKVPGAYNIYAAGTNGDVTILAWINSSGEVIVKQQNW